MSTLALFPLETVLFPGMQLKLHIFEERYKSMINQCIESQRGFGIALIRSGREALGPAALPHEVGCAVTLSEVQRLPQGRMNIVVTGQRRFRIKALDRSQAYLVGEVEYFQPAEDKPKLIQACGGRLRPLVLRYLKMLTANEDTEIDPDKFPNSARAVAQVGAILLQADNETKQELLALDSLSRLMLALLEQYRLEVALLEAQLSPPGTDFDIGSFSSN